MTENWGALDKSGFKITNTEGMSTKQFITVLAQIKKMKNKKTRNTIIILSLLYFLFAIALIGLLYGTGHKIDFFSIQNIENLVFIGVFLITSITLFLYSFLRKVSLKYISIFFLFISLIAILYNVYVLFSVNPNLSDIVVPLLFILFILFLNIRVLYVIIRYNPNA